MHENDRIFGEWLSPLTTGLGHGLDNPVSSVYPQTINETATWPHAYQMGPPSFGGHPM